jgi:DNA invertase Pin-like site-specific DNA recombinase
LHFFTEERVKAGLANARAKGKLIGRKKMRDSDLIRKLLKAGMTFRQIAQIARCSHGSVWAEKSAMMKEEAAQALIANDTQPAPTVVFPDVPTAA